MLLNRMKLMHFLQKVGSGMEGVKVSFISSSSIFAYTGSYIQGDLHLILPQAEYSQEDQSAESNWPRRIKIPNIYLLSEFKR